MDGPLTDLNRRLQSLEAHVTKLRQTNATPKVASSVAPSSPASGMVAITPVEFETNLTTAKAWTTKDVSDIVPLSATWIQLESEWALQDPDIGALAVDAYVRIRPDSSWDGEYILSRGRCAGPDDNIAGANQGWFKLSGHSFDYEVELGFGNGLFLRITAYV